MSHVSRIRVSLLVALAGAVSLVAGLLPGGASPAQARTAQPAGTTVIASHSGQALDVSGVSQAAGAQVIQWPSNGGPNQRWTFERLDDGTYRIVVGHSGQVLDVAGASEAAGARVVQWPWNGGANQRWRVEDVAGQGERIVAVHSGLVLDVAGASQDGGARVIQWPWIDVDGQAILQVKLRNIALPPDAPAGVEPWDGPDRLALPGTGPIVEVVEDTVYEGVHTFFVGVTDRLAFQVNRLGAPQRVVIDVAAS